MAINPEQLQRVVLAGEKIMYDKSTFHIFQAGLSKPGPLPEKLAKEAAGLVKILNERAKPAIPKNLIIPSAVMLLTEMADFMVKAKLATPTKEDIVAAIKMLVEIVMKLYGVQQPAAQGVPQQPAAPQPAAPAQPGMIGA